MSYHSHSLFFWRQPRICGFIHVWILPVLHYLMEWPISVQSQSCGKRLSSEFTWWIPIRSVAALQYAWWGTMSMQWKPIKTADRHVIWDVLKTSSPNTATFFHHKYVFYNSCMGTTHLNWQISRTYLIICILYCLPPMCTNCIKCTYKPLGTFCGS